MAKVINRYLAIPSEYFTPDNIKDRSSDIGTETVVSNTVEVDDITMTNIHDALSESNYSLQDLYNSSLVNQYSKFGAFTRLLVPVIGEDYKELSFNRVVDASGIMGNFAGYNHLAIIPKCDGINFADQGSYQVVVCAGETAFFVPSYYIRLGEIDWYELDGDIDYMKVLFTNSDLSVVYATSSNFTLNTTNFTKTASDFYKSTSTTLSSTTSLTRTYYMSYRFYDSSNNELIQTGSDERISFTVQYVFTNYGVDAIEIEANTKFDEVAYSSMTFVVTVSTAIITYFDFITKEEGNCVNERIQIYVAYPDSTTWERYTCDVDFDCSPTGDLILNLDDNRVDCATNMRILMREFNILDCPATIPF